MQNNFSGMCEQSLLVDPFIASKRTMFSTGFKSRLESTPSDKSWTLEWSSNLVARMHNKQRVYICTLKNFILVAFHAVCTKISI